MHCQLLTQYYYNVAVPHWVTGKKMRPGRTLWLHAPCVSQVCPLTFGKCFLFCPCLFNANTDRVHIWYVYALKEL